MRDEEEQKMRDISRKVEGILLTNERSRNSDNILYLEVIRKVAHTEGINLDAMNVPEFFLHLGDYGFPSYETVSRVRRKLQEENPWLEASKRVKEGRAEKEAEMREWARR